MEMPVKQEGNEYAKRFYESLKKEKYEAKSSYVNAKKKVHTVCSSGHDYFVSPEKFKIGKRCPKCREESKRIFFANRFYEDLKANGYSDVNDEYKKGNEKVKTKCRNGHIYMVTPTAFRTRDRCKRCMKTTYSSRFYEALDESGYRLVEGEKYTLIKNPVSITCPQGHTYKPTPANF